MGRPRKPTKVLEASGALKRNPARYRDRVDEPRPGTLVGDPPADFLRPDSPTAARHLRIWHELIAQAPAGVLTGSDRLVLENACRVQALIELGRATPAQFNLLRNYLNDLGMTPAGRSKISIQAPSSKNEGPWKQLAEVVAMRTPRKS